MILQMIANGLLLGGFYASIGVAFSLVYGIMGIINLAQGTQIILGAYLTFATCELFHIDPFLTIPVSGLILFITGYAIQRWVVNMVGKGGVVLTSLLTFGLNLVMINVILLIWSADFRGINPSYAGKNFEVVGVTIPYVRLAVFFIAVGATMILHWFLGHTETGNAIHASSQNKRAAQIVGINIRRSYALTFAIELGACRGHGVALCNPETRITLLGRRPVDDTFPGRRHRWTGEHSRCAPRRAGHGFGRLLLGSVAGYGVSENRHVPDLYSCIDLSSQRFFW